MLMCDQTVTLVHHVKGNDEDTYTCTIYDKASWFAKQTISTSKDGEKPSNSYEVRILTREDIPLSTGDYVVLGAISSVVAPSDLARYEHFRVTAIGDNRRGKLAHWRLSGQ